jgi:hypothetical protein
LAEYRRQENNGYAARTLILLSEVALRQGNGKQAIALLEESLSLYRSLQDNWDMAQTYYFLGHVVLQGNEHKQSAEDLFRDGLACALKVENPYPVLLSLAGLASVAGVRVKGNMEKAQRAARIFGSVEALLEAKSIRLDPMETDKYLPYIAVARTQLDETTWEAAWAEGSHMNLEEAVTYSLEGIKHE